MKNLIMLLFVCLCFANCKKKDAPSPIQTQATTGSTQPQQFDGFLQVITAGGFNDQLFIGTYFSTNVYLQSSPSATNNLQYCTNSGTVILNDTYLKYGGLRYYDTTYVLKCRTLRKFQLNSNNSLPSFTVNITDSVPTFPANYYSLLGDTMYRSKNFKVPLNSFTYPDEIECYIYDYNNYTISKKIIVKKGTSEINLSPNDISIFQNNSSLNCQITLRKFNDQNFGGKNFRFSTELFSYFDIKVQP